MVARCRRGDEAAFDGLVTLHGPMLWRIAYRITGSREDADDLSQEAFIRAFRTLGRFRGQAKFSTYLGTIVVRLSLNQVRRSQRRRNVSIGQQTEPVANGQTSPRTEAQGHELSQTIEQALALLPPDFRAALALTAIEGLSHRQAAQMLGCAESTVSWRVHEARKRLREALKKDGQRP